MVRSWEVSLSSLGIREKLDVSSLKQFNSLNTFYEQDVQHSHGQFGALAFLANKITYKLTLL